MDCKAFSNLLDAWLDGELSREDQARMEAHAAECPACAALLTLRRDCREMDESVEVPAAFSASWREMIRAEAEPARKKPSWRTLLTVAAALVFVVGGTLATRGSLRIEAPVANRPAVTEQADGNAASAHATGLPAAAAYAAGTSAPTYPPVLETAEETADADWGAPGRKTAESLAVTNVQYASMRQEDAAWEAEETEDAFAAEEEALWEEIPREEAMAAGEAAYEALDEAPREEAEAEASDADGMADEAAAEAGEDEAATPPEAQEISPGVGLTLLCALPWIAVAAAVLLILKKKRH